MLKKSIMQMFPKRLRPVFEKVAEEGKYVQEIRLRANRPVLVIHRKTDTCMRTESFLTKDGMFESNAKNAFCMEPVDLEEMLQHLCNYSIYAYDEEIRQGYLTLPGGHRVGLSGQVVYDTDKVRTIKYIHFMNIRVAHEIKDVAEPVLHYLYKDNSFLDTLIVSPPGCGKTTLLRDIVRKVSDGNEYGRGRTVGLVDERSEIAGMYQGLPQNDVGMRTDVLDACPKVYGMMLLIRAMSPEIIAVDELGNSDDITAMEHVMHCGSKIVATIHGDSIEHVQHKRFVENIFKDKLFDRYILLGKKDGKCVIEGVYDKDFRLFSDYSRDNRLWSQHS